MSRFPFSSEAPVESEPASVTVAVAVLVETSRSRSIDKISLDQSVDAIGSGSGVGSTGSCGSVGGESGGEGGGEGEGSGFSIALLPPPPQATSNKSEKQISVNRFILEPLKSHKTANQYTNYTGEVDCDTLCSIGDSHSAEFRKQNMDGSPGMPQQAFIGTKAYFPTVDTIGFEGRESDNPLAFKFYDPNKIVADKTMREHLRFAACYWHTFCAKGSDPFGQDTQVFPWDNWADPMDAARARMDAAFEFFTKLGVPYYCFHDRDMAPEGETVGASESNLATMVELAAERQAATGMKLLWGTANLFGHPRYMNGAATNPDFAVVAHAGAQVKAALDATVALNGENYVFWGGREGYFSLLNTDTRRELDHLARFLEMARDYGRSVGFTGTYLIEPKPMEPTKHQYDFDTQTVVGFLRHYGLADDFKVNVEANHATLAGHSFAHELQMAANAGLLGSIDANRGDPQNGWDTDQFPTDVYDTVFAMMVVLNNGGLGSGGLNFDAKVRRESVDLEDLFLGHIGGMDTFARGLEVAQRIADAGQLSQFLAKRYESFDNGQGRAFENGEIDLASLATLAETFGEPELKSGKQEWCENIINQYL